MDASGITVPGGAVEALRLPPPAAPGPGEVLVAVEAAGVGRWDDIVRTGGWDVGLAPPAALGVEGTGRVIAVGDGVRGLSVDDAVLGHAAPLPGGSGFWAEQVRVSAAQVALRPAGLRAVAAAALPVGGLTAVQALDAVALHPGERLLVTGGAGGTGALVVQLAARAGLRVTATASAASAPRLRRLGATHVLDYRDPDALPQLGRAFDAAIVAAIGTAPAALAAVRDDGRLCSLTSDAPPAERGIATADLYVRPDAAQLARVAALAAEGALLVEPEVVPLGAAADALGRVLAGRTGGRKLVLSTLS